MRGTQYLSQYLSYERYCVPLIYEHTHFLTRTHVDLRMLKRCDGIAPTRPGKRRRRRASTHRPRHALAKETEILVVPFANVSRERAVTLGKEAATAPKARFDIG